MKSPASTAQTNTSFSPIIHGALVATDVLGRVPWWLLLPLWAGIVVAAAWPWDVLRGPAVLLGGIMLAGDAAMLALLPHYQRSWGPVTPPLLGLALLRAALTASGGWLSASPGSLLIVTCLHAGLTGTALYATWIEPFRVTVTRQHAPVLPAGSATLRVLHLSDLHFEGYSPREHALLDAVTALQPDLILLTGDYLNLSSVHDPQAQAGARALLAQLDAPLGIYAVTGSPVVDADDVVPRIFADLDIHWLDDAAVAITPELWLLGARCTYTPSRDRDAVARLVEGLPAGARAVLLYHTPDLMPEIVDWPIALYLCGHTHGGQLRLPWYGALFTSSAWGKRYEMGRYQEGRTILYVSRGLGLEGWGAPRARFLSPPEIILWEWHAPESLPQR